MVPTDIGNMPRPPDSTSLVLGRAGAHENGLARLADWIAESRAHRVICLLVGIWILNAFDLTLTILAHQQGMLHEENPVAREFLRQGPVTISLYKLGLVLLGSYPLIRYRAARITELGALVVLVAYASLAMHWSTVYDIYTLTATSGLSVAELDRLSGIVTH